MRDLHDVKVLRGVTHVVAPRSPNTLLQLSEVELPLDGGVGEILSRHVDNGLHDPQARAAKFALRGDDRTSSTVAHLMNPRARLIDLSHGLAKALYTIAERDERVSDGTLAILLCEAGSATGARVRFPAILKLDPSAKLRSVTDREPSTNKLRVRYEVDANTLPSVNERIQKCAFISVVDERAEYELLVVDRQRRADVVSKFWVGDFLGAELALDAAERTKRLYRSLRQGRNEVEPELDATELAALDQVIAGAVVQDAVNLDVLIRSLPIGQVQRDKIDAVVSESLVDRDFELDREVAGQFVRRRVYRADNNLRLTIGSEFSSMIHVEDLEPGGSDSRLRRIWFETRTWKEN